MRFQSSFASLWRRSLTALLLLGSLLPVHAGKPVWLKLESKEFVIYSDADEKNLVQSALRYAAYRRAFDELFVPVGGALPTTKLILFRTEKEFRTHVPSKTRDHTKLVNFSTEIDGTPLSTFALSSDPARALQMTCEFETIWGLRLLGYHVPVWMSQGAGEVLSEIKIKSEQIVIGDIDGRGQPLPWREFFEVGENSKLYQDNEQLGDYLVQARELMHWILLDTTDTQQRFSDLAFRLRTSPAVEAVQTVMNAKESEFDKRIRQHLRRTPTRTLVYHSPTVLAGFHVSPAPEAEVLVATGELLVAADRAYEGNTNLDRARSLAPDLAAVKEAWARRMFREGRAAEAVECYRDAIAAGSKNFAAYLRSAVGRLDDARTRGSDVAGEGGEPAMTAINELRQAIRLNPGSAEAYQALGRAFYVAPRLAPENVAELSQGVFLGEQGAVVQIYRAALYYRLDQLDDALDELRQALKNPDLGPSNRDAAQRRIAAYLFNRDAKRIDALVRAKDYAGAREILTAAATVAECAPAAADYRRIEQWVEETEAWTKIGELAGTEQKSALHAAAQDFVKRFPRSALRREALRIVEATRDAVTNPPVAEVR